MPVFIVEELGPLQFLLLDHEVFVNLVLLTDEFEVRHFFVELFDLCFLLALAKLGFRVQGANALLLKLNLLLLLLDSGQVVVVLRSSLLFDLLLLVSHERFFFYLHVPVQQRGSIIISFEILAQICVTLTEVFNQFLLSFSLLLDDLLEQNIPLGQLGLLLLQLVLNHAVLQLLVVGLLQFIDLILDLR